MKTKSHDPDNIFQLVVREARDIISKPLATLFRNSLNNGEEL